MSGCGNARIREGGREGRIGGGERGKRSDVYGSVREGQDREDVLEGGT